MRSAGISALRTAQRVGEQKRVCVCVAHQLASMRLRRRPAQAGESRPAVDGAGGGLADQACGRPPSPPLPPPARTGAADGIARPSSRIRAQFGRRWAESGRHRSLPRQIWTSTMFWPGLGQPQVFRPKLIETWLGISHCWADLLANCRSELVGCSVADQPSNADIRSLQHSSHVWCELELSHAVVARRLSGRFSSEVDLRLCAEAARGRGSFRRGGAPGPALGAMRCHGLESDADF